MYKALTFKKGIVVKLSKMEMVTEIILVCLISAHKLPLHCLGTGFLDLTTGFTETVIMPHLLHGRSLFIRGYMTPTEITVIVVIRLPA